MTKTVTLRQIADDEGSQSLTASITANGDLVMEGLDYGDGVENIFGEREYAYALTVSAANVPALLSALGAKNDILTALQEAFQNPDLAGPSALLNQYNIPFTFWSRMGC